MESYKEHSEKASKTRAVLSCVIIVLLIALLISLAGDKSAAQTLISVINQYKP